MKKVLNINLSLIAVVSCVAVTPAHSQPASKASVKSRPVATAVPSYHVAASTSAVSIESFDAKVSEEVVSSGAPAALAASPRWPLPVAATRVMPSPKRTQSAKTAAVKPIAAKAFPAKTVVQAHRAVSAPAIASKPVGLSGTTSATAPKAAPSRPALVALLPPRPVETINDQNVVIAPAKKSATKVITTSTLKTVKVTTSVKAAPVKMARRTPTSLSSRSKDRMLLAKLEADLRRAQGRLDNASQTLSSGQKQLMKVGSTLQKAMLEAGNDAKGLHPFVRVAQRYAGTPYVWGGESRNGFDCSGFIIVVMRDLGYRALPHSAAEQFNYGTPIAKPLLKAGDIVFFKNTYKPGVSHVGIYIGRSRFIHAAGTGTGTIVSYLSEPKWIKHYAGARRLVRH